MVGSRPSGGFFATYHFRSGGLSAESVHRRFPWLLWERTGVSAAEKILFCNLNGTSDCTRFKVFETGVF